VQGYDSNKIEQKYFMNNWNIYDSYGVLTGSVKQTKGLNRDLLL